MTTHEIKELIALVNETGIFELEVQNGDNRVRIRRGGGTQDQQVVIPAVMPVAVGPGAANPVSVPAGVLQAADSIAGQPPPPAAAKAPADDERNTLIKSPIVGTYYDSPSPGAAPFVKVGDHVHPKQVLCIIESMKLMNEIEAEISGTVLAKFVDNGRPVEYGEALFSIGPA